MTQKHDKSDKNTLYYPLAHHKSDIFSKNHHFHSSVNETTIITLPVVNKFYLLIRSRIMLNVESILYCIIQHSTLFVLNLDFENLFTSGLEMVVNL